MDEKKRLMEEKHKGEKGHGVNESVHHVLLHPNLEVQLEEDKS